MGRRGFTIVELLIVIIVIAILAAMTIVAYNGIQTRAYETTVQADMRNTNAKLAAAKVVNGAPPTADQAGLTGAVVMSKGAYLSRTNDSVIYCRSDTDYGIVAISRNGQAYMSKNGGPITLVSSWGGSSTSNACSANTTVGMMIPSTDPGYAYIVLFGNNTWVSWL